MSELLKPYVRGKHIDFREITLADAEFVLSLRIDPELSQHISAVEDNVERQRDFIRRYQESLTDYYFIIMDKTTRPVGTIRIYDIQGDSFCWGSWILAKEKPFAAGIESALMLYDFAFFSLHYARSHFDVRKANTRVVEFHQRFGATVVREDADNLYFTYDRAQYMNTREAYRNYLPE